MTVAVEETYRAGRCEVRAEGRIVAAPVNTGNPEQGSRCMFVMEIPPVSPNVNRSGIPNPPLTYHVYVAGALAEKVLDYGFAVGDWARVAMNTWMSVKGELWAKAYDVYLSLDDALLDWAEDT